ncbi:MAG: TetR/AcrR family transcriptional regulator [Azospirillaceae bacterium]|nr:TetR/AcrR family transcriptional regulator [Azospirillaceae bacterium]
MIRPLQSPVEREQTRQRILDAARVLFDSDGLDAVSLRAIATRVGMTAPALYRYFPSKGELVRALWRGALLELRIRLEAISAAEPQPLAALRAIGAAYVAFGVEDPLRFRILFLWSVESVAPDIPADPEIQSVYGVLRRRVAEAVAQGLIRCPDAANTDIDAVVQMFWAAAHGIIILGTKVVFPCDSMLPMAPPIDLANATIATLLRGLAPRTHLGDSP